MSEHGQGAPGPGGRPGLGGLGRPVAASGWQYVPGRHGPSGLFPSRVNRPAYREPHPVRGGAVAAGIGVGVAWLLVFGLLGRDLRGYAWWTILAGAAAWLVSLVLARSGDRGAAVGVAIATSLGWGFAATAVAVRWATTGDWPLW